MCTLRQALMIKVYHQKQTLGQNLPQEYHQLKDYQFSQLKTPKGQAGDNINVKRKMYSIRTPNYEEVKSTTKSSIIKKSDHSLSSYTNHVVYCKYNSIFFFRLYSPFQSHHRHCHYCAAIFAILCNKITNNAYHCHCNIIIDPPSFTTAGIGNTI